MCLGDLIGGSFLFFSVEGFGSRPGSSHGCDAWCSRRVVGDGIFAFDGTRCGFAAFGQGVKCDVAF
jgi:hypothetical protein